MRKFLLKFLLGYEPVVKEYPYRSKFGDLTHDQANVIYHWLRMGGVFKGEIYISPSTMVTVDKNTTYFEKFTVEINKELTVIIKS